MTKIDQAKSAVLSELALHHKPKPANTIVQLVIATLTGPSIEPVSKNVIQQAITALKKEGAINYTPSLKGGSHLIQLAETTKEQPMKLIKPIDKTPLDNFVTGYELYDMQGAFICREPDLAAAQAKAQELVIAKMMEIEIKIVTTSTHCRFKPVVHAEYIAA